ncbi:methyltransferase domain-containing protein [Azospirillum sp. TSO35-2]|uniref:class I SAM-dependent methyltransferase n=1 Tax=Azospirillum sp. TSO35-2 TaxID=716796 RepID=UPI000D64FBA3|nr:methyltransferase domain-containing protein [Azospirillum sp. TSO35-2]
MKLHIGGHKKHSDWHIFDISPSEVTDFVGNCTDMSQFPDNSIEEIYASHVLEHLSHNGELASSLREFLRILTFGGKISISVPDFMEIARAFCADDLTTGDRYKLSRLAFGGQRDEFDLHKIGFSYDILELLLREIGFCNVSRIDQFNLFDDASRGKVDPRRQDGSICQSIDRIRFSINAIAYKPGMSGTAAVGVER